MVSDDIHVYCTVVSSFLSWPGCVGDQTDQTVEILEVPA